MRVISFKGPTRGIGLLKECFWGLVRLGYFWEKAPKGFWEKNQPSRIAGEVLYKFLLIIILLFLFSFALDYHCKHYLVDCNI